MKKINASKAINDLSLGSELAKIDDSGAQYDTGHVALFKLGKAYIYREDLTGHDIVHYLVDIETDSNDEVNPETNPEQWLKEILSQFDFYDATVERLTWGLDTPDEVAASTTDTGPFNVIEIGDYNGYSPVTRILENGYGPVIEFPTYAAAQAWIEDAESGDYYLGNNEAGRPDYVIVQA